MPRLDQPFVTGVRETPAGAAPQVSPLLTFRDKLGGVKARWGVGRMSYKVDPGLYALGQPDETSPVLVSANYKMSFDRLRESVSGRNVWILVLDTKGINVWCAAGKGTFGTKELAERIASSGLSQIVSHRELILPQLAGPGVSAHQVRKLSGFKVHYGPVCASYLPEFLDAGLKATDLMRRKTFAWRERVVLIPMELVAALKVAACVVPGIFVIAGFVGSGEFWSSAWRHGAFAAGAFMAAVFTGAVCFPVLLPFLPGRAFSSKGFILGAVAAVILFFLKIPLASAAALLEALSWLLLVSALTAYLAMNFTGASTFTSLSGVKREMRWAIPAEAIMALAGIVLWLWSLFLV